MSESYFFAISPKFLKTEHSFAKNVKPNSKYRLAVFKGIQKCDQMAEGVKSKIVNGKIQLQSKELMFNIPYFSPTKNIQFTIKLYEQKPSEEEAQIAGYTFGSSDYIKQFKADKQTAFQVNGQLQTNLGLQFDLFVEKSKQLLNEAIKKSSSNIPKSPRQAQDDNVSQQSKQLIREGEGFLSPKRKLQRKRGHEGRLRSRSRSQEKSQTLVTSPRSIPKSTASGKNLNNLPDTKAPVKDQKTYQYQPPTKLKYTDTKEIFDIKIERGSSPVRSPRDAQNAVKSPQTRTSFISSPQQNNTQNANQPITNALTRTNVASPIQTKTISPLTSTKSQAASTQDLEIKHNSKVFDIVPRQKVTSPKSEQPKSPGKYEPKRQPKIIEFQSQVPAAKVSKVEPKTLASGPKQSTSLLGANLQAPNFETINESKIVITVEGQVNEPKAVIIGEEDVIQVKARPVTKKDGVRQSGTLRSSLRLSQVAHSKEHEAQVKKAEKSFEERKYDLLYALFLVASVFLIYLAMCPTRKV